MSRATEQQLAVLHSRVASSMIAALEQADRATALLVKYSIDEKTRLPRDVERFLEEAREVNPSLLTSATKFLKDNNISCDPEEDAGLSELAQQLANKRQEGKGNVTSIKFSD